MKPDGMESPETTPSDGGSLRRRAEETPGGHPAEPGGSLSHEEALALVHELQVHLSELELQNEELMRTRREAEGLRNRYADLYDLAPVGYFTLDEVGVIREANLAGAVQLGVEQESLIRTEFATLLHPDSRPDFAAFCVNVLAGGATETCEALFEARAGREAWYAQLRGRADAAGAAVFVRLVVTDITERKEAEAALQEYAERLRASNEELQRFAYVASHDLQAPLRSIVSFSQLLERRCRGKLDHDADDYIAFIVEGGTRMQALILDLLQVSRVETGAKPVEPTDANAVVNGALRALETPILEAGASVTVGALPAAMADPSQLEQVFVNLVGNAIKYRHPDRPPAIRIEGSQAGPMVEFAVKDNGIGIEPEYFGRIFQMFQRLHTHEEREGTGIGLAIVKKIVERHGGRVWLESTPGEGSIFLFTLPAA